MLSRSRRAVPDFEQVELAVLVPAWLLRATVVSEGERRCLVWYRNARKMMQRIQSLDAQGNTSCRRPGRWTAGSLHKLSEWPVGLSVNRRFGANAAKPRSEAGMMLGRGRSRRCVRAALVRCVISSEARTMDVASSTLSRACRHARFSHLVRAGMASGGGLTVRPAAVGVQSQVDGADNATNYAMRRFLPSRLARPHAQVKGGSGPLVRSWDRPGVELGLGWAR